MDELELLLEGLRDEQPQREAVERGAAKVYSRLRRRRVTQIVLGLAPMVAAVSMIPEAPEPVELPEPVKAIITVPDLIVTVSAPVNLSSHRAKPKARMVDEHTIRLASSNPNVVIDWSME
ncbi:MAG: hypothetical protein FJW36_24995 [Acidobacteria bacterium]|nr:hypothetical protein [Acidobacteriota bacterium]